MIEVIIGGLIVAGLAKALGGSGNQECSEGGTCNLKKYRSGVWTQWYCTKCGAVYHSKDDDYDWSKSP